MNCIKCGKVLSEGSNYCPQCGKNVAIAMGMQKHTVKEEKVEFCKKCGTQSQGGRYCGQCGTELSKRQFVEKSAIGLFTAANDNVSENVHGFVNYIKEKCTAGKKVDILTTFKHGAVFSVCMLIFTLLFVLVVQKAANLLPVFQNKFFAQNPGLRDIKMYVLAAMYGLKVKHTGNIAVTLKAGIKILPLFIVVTLLFVAISFLIMRKVSGRDNKYNMLELMIIASTNSIGVIVCSLIFWTKTEINQSTGFYDLSFVTESSGINCFCMAFLITLLLLIIVNGIKCKKEERNSTLLYALRSNLIVMAVVFLFVVILCVVVAVKTPVMKENVILLVIPLFQMFYVTTGGFGSRILMMINGTDLFKVSMNSLNTKYRVLDLADSQTNSKWLMAAIGLMTLFLIVRVVLDVARILKDTNTEDTRETIIELCKYSGGFALITAFISSLFSMGFKGTLYIPATLSELQGYEMLNGKSMGLSLGAGNAVGVFFKVFLCTLIVGLVVFWIVKMNSRIIYSCILAKKKIILSVMVLLVCMPAIYVLSVSENRMVQILYSYSSDDSGLNQLGTKFSDEQLMQAMERTGLNEEFLYALENVYYFMKDLVEDDQ